MVIHLFFVTLLTQFRFNTYVKFESRYAWVIYSIERSFISIFCIRKDEFHQQSCMKFASSFFEIRVFSTVFETNTLLRSIELVSRDSSYLKRVKFYQKLPTNWKRLNISSKLPSLFSTFNSMSRVYLFSKITSITTKWKLFSQVQRFRAARKKIMYTKRTLSIYTRLAIVLGNENEINICRNESTCGSWGNIFS